MTNRDLEIIHFLTDSLNYRILRKLLDSDEPYSFSRMARDCKINKSQAKNRLLKFLELRLVDWHLDKPKYENQRFTKCYTQIFTIKPSLRSRLNDFIDIVDGLVQPKIRQIPTTQILKK